MMITAVSQDHRSDTGKFVIVEPRSRLKLKDNPIIKTEAKEGAARAGLSCLLDVGKLLWLA